jgi:hypothetical protein
MDNENEAIEEQQPTPDDMSGVHVESFIKIFDPDTGDIIVEGRA